MLVAFQKQYIQFIVILTKFKCKNVFIQLLIDNTKQLKR